MDDVIAAALEGDRAALRTIGNALKPPLAEDIRGAISALSPAQTARLILQLRPRDGRALIHALPDAPSLTVLRTLSPGVAEDLIDDERVSKLAKMIGKLPEENAAEVLSEMPVSVRSQILERLGHPVSLVRSLEHMQDSAGAVMQHRLVSAYGDQTIGDVIETIRANSDHIEKIYAVYVIDGERRLTGYLKVRDLLLNEPGTRVSDIQRDNPVIVTSDTDREEVAKHAAEEALPVLPVVDAEGRLIGRITPTELREITEAEDDEDIKIMAGLRPDAQATDGPLRIVPQRLPWLAGGLVGAGTAAMVVGSYEDALTEAAILASLIPIVMSLAGNAGIQASTVTVQAQTAQTFWVGELHRRLFREACGALLNGAAVGTIVAFAILILGPIVEIDRAPALAATATLTLVAVTTQAAVVGALVPVILKRFGFDPAVATGVFITTSNDVIGVLIFFLIASHLYL